MGKRNKTKRSPKQRVISDVLPPAPVFRRSLPTLLLGGVLLVMVGAAFENAVHPGVVHDDRFFFPGDKEISGADLVRYFTEDTWAATGTTSGVFRPLLMASIALDHHLFGGDATGYHRTNVILHAVFVLLLFLFFKRLLGAGTEGDAGDGWSSRPLWGAWIAAAVFGLNPITTEAVASIFNRSEILAAIGMFSALYVLWTMAPKRPLAAWGIVAVIYGVSLLFKESAATLPIIAVVMMVLFRPEATLAATVKRLRPALLLLLPLAGYLALRANALGGLTGEETGEPFTARAVIALGTLGDLMRMAVFPYPQRASYADYVPPHLLLSAAVHVVLIGTAVWAYRRRLPAVVFGIVFFYIAAIPSSRLMTSREIAVPLAERYAYIPAAGLWTVLAFGVRSGLRGRWFPVTITAAAAVLLLFGVGTHVRNEAWHSNLALFEAEYAAAPESGETLRLLTGAYLGKKDYDAVVGLCDKHLAAHRNNPKFNNHCGAAYDQARRYDDAETAYLAATASGDIGSVPFVNLGRLYLRLNRWAAAKDAFEKGVAAEDNPARKHLRRGHMLTRLYPGDRQKLTEAKAEFETALSLQPGLGTARTWLSRVNRSLAAR